MKKQPGKNPSAIKGKKISNHGEGKNWQFHFPKNEETEVLTSLLRVASPEDLEERFGIKLDRDLQWGLSMRDIVKNVLVTVARGSLKAKPKERKGGIQSETKKSDVSNNDSLNF